MNTAREQWSSRDGFLLATIGGAVGMGNIWRFSYVAGENGGAAFLLIYLACIVLIGLPLMIAELAPGRRARGDAITAFEWGSAGRRTLPQVFLQMPGGHLIGAVFFFLLCIAALTSMVALLEIPVAALTHRTKLRHGPATAGMGTLVILLGLPSALSYGVLGEVRIGSLGILDTIDAGVSNVLLPAAGIGAAIYVGWGLERAAVLAESDLGAGCTGRAWLWLVRVVVPVTILLQSTGVF